MSNFVVCVDVDNVLNNLTEQTNAFFNDRMGTNLTIEDHKEYDVFKTLSFEDAQHYSNLWEEKALWDSLTPIKDAQWGIRKLMGMDCKVIFATSTLYINFAWKCEWIKKHFPFIDIKDVICINDKSMLKADVLIDDNLDQLMSGLYERIVFDYPWNRRSELYDGSHFLTRCSSWDEVVKTVARILKRH